MLASAALMCSWRQSKPAALPLLASVELEFSFSDRPVDLIEDGFDLAIRSGNIGDGAGLMTRTIGVPAHDSLRRTHLSRKAWPARAVGRPSAPHRHRLRAYRAHPDLGVSVGDRQTLVEATPPSRLRFDDAEAIADAAEAGHGLAWLPCWLLRDRVRSGTLIPLFGDVPRGIFVTHALRPKTPHLPLRERFAIDALRSPASLSLARNAYLKMTRTTACSRFNCRGDSRLRAWPTDAL